MIFVTVGSSLPHDDLIRTVDDGIKNGKIKDEVIMQIGNGKYIPQNAKYFRFRPSLEPYYERAEVIVSNCGAGTILENIKHGRRLLVVQNPDVIGGHEMELVETMWRNQHLMFCHELRLLHAYINGAKIFNVKKFKAKKLDINKVLSDLK